MTVVESLHRRLWAESQDGSDVDARIHEMVIEALPLANAAGRAEVENALRARVGGLGSLDRIARDPLVSEIMVNSGSEVWVERKGQLERMPIEITSDEVDQLVRRLASAAGRRIDRSEPAVDVRLADGSRLHAILPPLAVDGPCMTIRRFGTVPFEIDDLADVDAVEVLVDAVRSRASIIVAGGTSSGKTTLLNALGAHLPASERVITIEDAAELRLPGDHVVRLETRSATERAAAVGFRELVRHALRMRPDRIICGETRGAEALDLVQAMNTGHPGSMTTVHANSVTDALRRIETMMLTADADLPLRAIREQLVSCVDLVVVTSRLASGVRTVVEIAELPIEFGETWRLRELYARGVRVGDPQRPWSQG